MKIFLMAGQSNMAGRGNLDDVKLILDPRIKVLRNGKWFPMTEPINYDLPHAGVGPAASFASEYLKKYPQEEIGFVACALGDTCMDEWVPGGSLFTHATQQAQLGLQAAGADKLTGILWQQGEADCLTGRTEHYEAKTRALLNAFRDFFDNNDLILLLGGIGSFAKDSAYLELSSYYDTINQALLRICSDTPGCYFVTADHTTCLRDHTHLDAVSQRIMGRRYFAAFDQATSVLDSLENEQEYADSCKNDQLLSFQEKMALYAKELFHV